MIILHISHTQTWGFRKCLFPHIFQTTTKYGLWGVDVDDRLCGVEANVTGTTKLQADEAKAADICYSPMVGGVSE